MVDAAIEKRTARWKTLVVALIGALIVYVLLSLLSGEWDFFTERYLRWPIVTGLITYGCLIYLVGGWLGYLICVRQWYAIPLCIVATFLIVSTSICAGCAFHYYSVQGHWGYLYMYIWRVLEVFLYFGWLVMAFLGTCLGIWIR